MERDDLPVYVYQASRSSLSPSINKKAKIEIATTVNAMEAFVKATYKLEGDNPLSFEAYQQLSILFASVSTQHYQNAKAKANGNASQDRSSFHYSKVCFKPAYNYFYQ